MLTFIAVFRAVYMQ